jgi:2-oxo-4-hydroxy-4-carboxy-5-ureidoimidazoline decarboxylase
VELNALPAPEAQRAFLRCCGSVRWAGAMAAGRPFSTEAEMLSKASRIWDALAPADWHEAFAAHPRIGGQATSAWSAEEQAGAASTTADIRNALADGNRRYAARFGYTFLICATGRSAPEMLAALEARLPNSAADELLIAAAEQRKITELRLKKLTAP